MYTPPIIRIEFLANQLYTVKVYGNTADVACPNQQATKLQKIRRGK